MFFFRTLSVLFIIAVLPAEVSYAQTAPFQEDIPDRAVNPPFSAKIGNIRNAQGKLYAYIVLLYMDNPHFINQIQEGTVSRSVLLNEELKLSLYENYLTSLKNGPNYKAAVQIKDIYEDYRRFSPKDISDIEKSLAERGTILKIAPPAATSPSDLEPKNKPTLDYCIYGEMISFCLKHPFIDYREQLYVIQPYIIYDEFSTSNSTFYHDMIYINHEEIENDFLIASLILKNRKIDRSLFFVGAPINEDIRSCLKTAFKGKIDVKKEIWKNFTIHEMTHKILNIRYKNFEQVRGEEMALSATIYENPRLGLATMYSYLEYQTMNPHRIAAINYLLFTAHELKDFRYAEDYSLIRNLSDDEIRRLTRIHFLSLISSLK